jgi:DNA-binding transcriptional LysR family regulator
VSVDVPQDLISQVASGLVDVAVLYSPPHRPGLKIDLLLEEKLVMVTTDPARTTIDGPEIVGVDWGPNFASEYAASFPDAPMPGLSVNLGPFALSYILLAGGSGYIRMRAAEAHLRDGTLHLVEGMPQFSYPIYAVYSTDLADSLVQPALAGLRAVQEG